MENNSNRRLVLSICWVILGIILVVLSAKDVIDKTMFAGMGGGFIVIGALQIIRNIRYRTDEKYKKDVDIAVRDERNRSIRLSAWAYAGYSFIVTACVAIIVLLVAGQNIYAWILGYCVCFILLVYWVSYMILQKKR